MKTVVVKVHNRNQNIQEIQADTKDGKPQILKTIKNVI